MLYFESNLTEREQEVRDIMVHLFNPVLKFVLMTSNYDEFKKYGFNSCRQTAILGAGYLQKLLPDYEFKVYEGHFIENTDGKFTSYDHAFIVAINNDEKRHLLIDLSRTTKKLLFTQTYLNLYPEIEDYENVTKIGQDLIDFEAMLNTDEPEFFTCKKPRDLLGVIETLVDDLKKCPLEHQMNFCDYIYTNTTMLRR
jgi:hypothetical protein